MSSDPHPDVDDGGAWWVLHTSTLVDWMKRAASGEDPDDIIMSEYMNQDNEDRQFVEGKICPRCGLDFNE